MTGADSKLQLYVGCSLPLEIEEEDISHYSMEMGYIISLQSLFLRCLQGQLWK